MRKTVLLTGASGEVGYEALTELVRRKDQFDTRILSLGTKSERKLFKRFLPTIKPIWGDLRNPETVARAVEGVDAVVHVAGIIPPVADHHPYLAHDVNVGGTKNILAAIRQQKIRPKLIFTSSISVYGDRLQNPDIQIGDPLIPSDGDEYARTKIAAEKMIQDAGTSWSIFRLCGILVKKLGIQPLMFHMPLDTALEWAHRTDVGYALVQAINEERVTGHIFNLGGGEKMRITARDFLRRMFPMWGLDAKILPDFAFATQNFHSGYYTDGDALEKILKFRRTTLPDYFDTVREKISPLQRVFVKSLPNFMIREWLLRMSEPLQAIKENNEKLIARYYGSREAFNQLVRG